MCGDFHLYVTEMGEVRTFFHVKILFKKKTILLFILNIKILYLKFSEFLSLFNFLKSHAFTKVSIKCLTYFKKNAIIEQQFLNERVNTLLFFNLKISFHKRKHNIYAIN